MKKQIGSKSERRVLDRYVFKPERREMTGVSDPTWWRLENAGLAPMRRQISPGRVAWLESEILEWMRSRPAFTANTEQQQNVVEGVR